MDSNILQRIVNFIRKQNFLRNTSIVTLFVLPLLTIFFYGSSLATQAPGIGDCGQGYNGGCGDDQPYFVVQGGDVSGGAGFTNSTGTCDYPLAGISGWNNDGQNSSGQGSNSGPFYGADAQDVVSTDYEDESLFTGMNSDMPLNTTAYNGGYDALGGYSEQEYNLANKDYPAFYPDSTRPFNQDNQDPTSTGWAGGGYNQTDCVPDYYSTITGAASLSSANYYVLNLCDLVGGNYSYKGTLIINDTNNCSISNTSTNNSPINLQINGNVYIESNITYSYDSPTDIPQLNIFAAGKPASGLTAYQVSQMGNIYVQNDVTEIHGFFVAEGNNFETLSDGGFAYGNYSNTTFTNGAFGTCATIGPDNTTITMSANYNECKAQLLIDGPVYANGFYLERDYDSVSDDSPTSSSTNADNAAEVVRYSAETWIPKYTANCETDPSVCLKNDNYTTETSLPPVL